MTVAAIIPARYESTRFPGKPLAFLGGKPLIQWVWESVHNSGLFTHVLVATDSGLIADTVAYFGGKAILTRSDHPSGSDRVAEVATGLDAEIVFNVQGDEPFIDKSALSVLLGSFAEPRVLMASLMTPFLQTDDIRDPNQVKVVCDAEGYALYFSRLPVPYDRDGLDNIVYKKHIGVYAYRSETLLRFVSLPPGKLEQAEKLEQLRALEHGIPIRMLETEYKGIGVDTPQDLAGAEVLLKRSLP